MIEIKDLLGRFNNLLLSEEGKKETVQKVISKIIGTKIEPESIQIKNNIIYLDIKPIYKNEIFLKQEEIFCRLKEFFDKKSSPTIR